MNEPLKINPPCGPKALNVALAQITEALQGAGLEKARELAATPEGYLKLLWMLEKLSKTSLDWHQAEQKSAEKRKIPGISPETERELERLFEGPPDDDIPLWPPSAVIPTSPPATSSPIAANGPPPLPLPPGEDGPAQSLGEGGREGEQVVEVPNGELRHRGFLESRAILSPLHRETSPNPRFALPPHAPDQNSVNARSRPDRPPKPWRRWR